MSKKKDKKQQEIDTKSVDMIMESVATVSRCNVPVIEGSKVCNEGLEVELVVRNGQPEPQIVTICMDVSATCALIYKLAKGLASGDCPQFVDLRTSRAPDGSTDIIMQSQEFGSPK